MVKGLSIIGPGGAPGYRRIAINLFWCIPLVFIKIPPRSCTPAHDHNLGPRGICLGGRLREYVKGEGGEIISSCLSRFSTFSEPPGVVHQIVNPSFFFSAILIDCYPRGELKMNASFPSLVDAFDPRCNRIVGPSYDLQPTAVSV